MGFSHNSWYLHLDGALFVSHHRDLQEGGRVREGGSMHELSTSHAMNVNIR